MSQASVLFLLPFLSSVREDLIYNVLVSGIQQSDSVTHIHTATLFQCFVYFFKMKKVPLLLIHVVYVHFCLNRKKRYGILLSNKHAAVFRGELLMPAVYF